MKQITIKMLEIYKPYSDLDWLNYRLVRKELTFHHIVKRADGGRETMENGAILMPIPHQYLHIIEFKDWKTYKHINDMFRIINDQMAEPTKEQREILEEMLLEFEIKHENDTTKRGKRLIKEEYLKRGY